MSTFNKDFFVSESLRKNGQLSFSEKEKLRVNRSAFFKHYLN